MKPAPELSSKNVRDPPNVTWMLTSDAWPSAKWSRGRDFTAFDGELLVGRVYQHQDYGSGRCRSSGPVRRFLARRRVSRNGRATPAGVSRRRIGHCSSTWTRSPAKRLSKNQTRLGNPGSANADAGNHSLRSWRSESGHSPVAFLDVLSLFAATTNALPGMTGKDRAINCNSSRGTARSRPSSAGIR